jgi:ribonuclease HI
MAEKKNIVEIYTDGACSGNPGHGGYGAVLLYNGHQKELSGFQENTTNNQMELKGAIEGLKALKRSSEIILYTDSIYVKNGISEWIKNWKINGWRGADKKPIKNQELWQELDLLASKHHITWKWIKGHNGNKYNDLADKLATEAIKKR